MNLIAHRGFSGKYIENTMKAFRSVVNETNVKIIEFDVRKSKDGVPIVFHDENLTRLCGINDKISDLTSDQIAEVLVKDERIPTLREVLHEFKKDLHFDIEIKTKNTALFVLKDIRESGVPLKNVIITSFNWDEIKQIRKLEKDVKTGLISLVRPKRCIDVCAEIGSQTAVLHHNFVNDYIVKYAHDKNIEVFVYTVNDKSRIEELLSLGVDYVITDFP